MTQLLSPPTPSPSTPAEPNASTFYRLTVEQYHDMIRNGTLGDRDPVELLDGILVQKMPEGPAHAGLIDIAADVLTRIVPPGWIVRQAHPITLIESEPEPDVAVARGDRRVYLQRHPAPADCGLVVEIANSSVLRDRGWKRQLYARAGVPVYWIILVAERAVEVYTNPSGPAAEPAYAGVLRYADGEHVQVVIDGREVGTVAVADLLP